MIHDQSHPKKRKGRHVELVQNFEVEFKNEISQCNSKITDLILALKEYVLLKLCTISLFKHASEALLDQC